MQNIISLIFRYFLSLFPACAGVIPKIVLPFFLGITFPRMRGGDPHGWPLSLESMYFSPHARG